MILGRTRRATHRTHSSDIDCDAVRPGRGRRHRGRRRASRHDDPSRRLARRRGRVGRRRAGTRREDDDHPTNSRRVREPRPRRPCSTGWKQCDPVPPCIFIVDEGEHGAAAAALQVDVFNVTVLLELVTHVVLANVGRNVADVDATGRTLFLAGHCRWRLLSDSICSRRRQRATLDQNNCVDSANLNAMQRQWRAAQNRARRWATAPELVRCRPPMLYIRAIHSLQPIK